MKTKVKDIYRCPYTGEPLRLSSEQQNADEVLAGTLFGSSKRYEIRDGIPHLISFNDENLTEAEQREYAYYQSNSKSYDEVMDWLFESFHEDENRIRESMVDLLELKAGDRILETGCGTCRDSVRIASRIGEEGVFFLQDLSLEMLTIGRNRMRAGEASTPSPALEFFVGNSVRLPFADNYFNGAFHFGGLNLFSDKKLAMQEMARVVRPGGKVVVGDESIAPWLRETEYGRILQNSNSLYRYQVPIDLVPEIAREVSLRWVIGSAFYVIEFRVGEGAPEVDLDKPILGFRGGTHRTRFYGGLEGVTIEAKEMAYEAARATGLSLHEWLEKAVRSHAKPALDDHPIKLGL